MFWLLLLACGLGDGDKSATDTESTCEVIEDRSCGQMTSDTEDSACPEGYSCWGPSAFVCYRGDCNLPICLDADTRIATPTGEVSITELSPGALVWTVGAMGERVAMPVLEVGSMHAPRGHQLLRVTLSDGRRVQASPGHPTALGERLEALQPGAVLDGAVVRSVERIDYQGETHDLLPAGPTGAYWADGVLLGSTLSR